MHGVEEKVDVEKYRLEENVGIIMETIEEEWTWVGPLWSTHVVTDLYSCGYRLTHVVIPTYPCGYTDLPMWLLTGIWTDVY